MIEVSADDVRRVALWRQGLLSAEVSASAATRAAARRQVGLVREIVDDLGAVQLDTISVLARSHELVAYARLGAVQRAAIEDAYWQGDSHFEYWSHAACILPMRMWPYFAFRRRHYQRRGQRWHGLSTSAITRVRARLRDDGPLTTTQVGGAKRGGAWWDWSDAKIALEWLLDIGEVACTQRTGWRRVYDLAERVVPADLRAQPLWIDADRVHGPSDEECTARLIADGARTVGIGTAADIADVHRLPNAAVARHADEVGLARVRVAGWAQSAWATSEALAWLDSGGRDRHRTSLLSPFDSLIWHRGRVERIFGMTHRLEAYTPAAKRVHGYFAMPVLHGGQLVARVDPKRDGAVLRAQRVTFEVDAPGRVPERAVDGVARALVEAAGWVGSDHVSVGSVVPRSATSALRTRLARLGGT